MEIKKTSIVAMMIIIMMMLTAVVPVGLVGVAGASQDVDHDAGS